MKPAVILVALCLSLVAPAHADELTPAKAADLRALFDLTGSTARVDQVLANAMAQMGPALRNCKDCTERTAQIVEGEIRNMFREGYAAPGGLLDRQIEIYHRHLSHEEVRQLLQFYRSPVGQKLTRALPAIGQEEQQAGRDWAQSMSPELRRRIAAAIERDRLLNGATPPTEGK